MMKSKCFNTELLKSQIYLLINVVKYYKLRQIFEVTEVQQFLLYLQVSMLSVSVTPHHIVAREDCVLVISFPPSTPLPG